MKRGVAAPFSALGGVVNMLHYLMLKTSFALLQAGYSGMNPAVTSGSVAEMERQEAG